jgi:hypothetical protein
MNDAAVFRISISPKLFGDEAIVLITSLRRHLRSETGNDSNDETPEEQ